MRVPFHIALALTMALRASAQDSAFDEYQVKAAFLYNFAKFVQWPAGSFANEADPIVICVAGANSFGSALEEAVRGKKIGERTFVARPVQDAQHGAKCQILFIGAAEWKRSHGLPEPPRDRGVLTVGESDDFAALGGMIGFKLTGQHVGLQIDVEMAERQGLQISSKLLNLAEIVKKRP